MKLLTTLYHKEHAKKLLSVADGLIIGNERFAARLTQSFNDQEINDIIKICSLMHKHVFIMANQMMTDQHINLFLSWIQNIDTDKISGIIVADLGVVLALESKQLIKKVIYHPETLLTNHHDFNSLNQLSIYGAFVAKEITLEDIKVIASLKTHQLFMMGHGHLNMFYSKRQLIKNHTTFAGINHTYHKRQNLKIVEENRHTQAYPILEDMAGTHVFRHTVFQTLSVHDTLKDIVDFLVIDSIFKDDSYAFDVLNLYHLGVKSFDEYPLKYNETWDQGFLFKKTIYKKITDGTYD